MVVTMRAVDDQHDDGVRLAQRRRTCQITPMAVSPARLIAAAGPTVLSLLLVTMGLTSACSSATPPTGPLRVAAAVSLTDALTAVAHQWEQAGNPRVELNFAASNVLARQILEGAPVDVFISADEKQVDRLVEAGSVARTDVMPLLTNQLVVVTPAGRPLSSTLPAALADQTVKRIAMGDPQGVPAGVYAKTWLERANLWRQVEPKIVPSNSVRAALAAVESANADAGIVYRTDARGRAGVTVAYEVPLDDAPAIVYPAAIITRSAHVQLARRFTAYLQTAPARNVFADAGFIAHDTANAR
jgi:molybdate transport system substrate-binding protein